MSDRKPYPPDDPFFKEHSRDEDEKLAEKLFYGTMVRDEKTGRDCHRYPPENSPHERQGVEALCRLLVFSCQDLEPGILAGLLCSLDLGGSFGRRLAFKPRKRKQPADSTSDLQIVFYLDALHRDALRRGERWKLEAAVQGAMEKFGVSRKTVFSVMKRVKSESPWLKF